MVSAEHYHVEVTLEDKGTGKREVHRYSNQGKGTPGYSQEEATALVKKLTEEIGAREDVELVGVSLKQMGVIASAHLGMPTE